MSVSQGEEAEQDFTVIRSEAAMYQRTHQYEKAIKRYGKALELSTEEKRCLVARSQCFLKIGDADKALGHAETSLKDKTFYKGILQKAEAMFYNGDFELALVYYHRGRRLRPDIQDFSLGIQKASEAIENSVGTADHVKLNTTGDLSFFDDQASVRQKCMGKVIIKGIPSANRGGVPPPAPGAKRVVTASKAHNRTVRQMLGELYKDKQYLENLLQATDDSTQSGKNICILADECLKYLDKRTDFWRQQKPMYSRLFERQVFKRKYGRQDPPSDAQILTALEKIDEAQTGGNYYWALKRANKCLQGLNSHLDSQVTNKMALKGQLHSCMGNAYLELGQYSRAMKHHEEDLTISQKYNIAEGLNRSSDNIGRVHVRQGDWQKALTVWESKLALTQSSLEAMWLCHEIGRCYLELGKPADATFYASQSLEEAQAEDNTLWQLHATVLMAQCEVKSRNLSSSLTYFEKALQLSIDLQDEEGEVALRKAVDNVVQNIKAEEERLAQKRRDSKMRRRSRSEKKPLENHKPDDDVKQEPRHQEHPKPPKPEKSPDEAPPNQGGSEGKEDTGQASGSNAPRPDADDLDRSKSWLDLF